MGEEAFTMSGPLFILAPPRSFTSVTCSMIGNHPEMFCLAETNLFSADTYAELERIYTVRPRFQHGLLRTVAELGLGGQTEEDIETAGTWLEEYHTATTAEIFADLMAWAEPRTVIDKSPIYVYNPGAIDRIKSAFPDARFLHLSRHPRATCESIYKTRQMAANAHAGVQLGSDANMTPDVMWLNPHLRIMEALEDVPTEQKMFLRGEALLANPPLYLRQIAEWLDIRTDQDAIDAMQRPEETPFSTMGPKNAPLGNDPNFMKEPKLRPFEEKPSDLDSPMSWDDSLVFDDVVKHYAMYFGY